MSNLRVGVLTGGGDSSGINAFLRSLCVGVWQQGGQVIGIRDGWAGLVELNAPPLTPGDVDRITMLPGTILGTSRTNVIKQGLEGRVVEHIERLGLTHLVVVGGDDTLGVAAHLSNVASIPVVGVPQTIDNDIAQTEYCLGFATAVQRGIDAVHGIVPSNRAHGNPMLVEVMGRKAGWLALYIALGTEADFLALPEWDWSIDDLVSAYQTSGPAVLAVIAEGVTTSELRREGQRVDAFGNPALEGVVHQVAGLFTERAGKTPRVQVLGYLLRGGAPVTADLQLAWHFAAGVLQAIDRGITGHMVAWQHGEVVYVPFTDVAGKQRPVPEELIHRWRRLLPPTTMIPSTRA